MTDFSIGGSIGGLSVSTSVNASCPRADNTSIADSVANLLKAGRHGEAVVKLDSAREGQPQAIQDALDRMVSARLDMSLNPSPSLGRVQNLFASPADVGHTLRRINDAGNNPPAMPVTTDLSDAQKFDVYSSIVETRATQAGNDALENGDRVIVGLRAENNTLDNGGTGVYNDRLVVIAKEADGTVHVNEFNRTSTEPTAQYDANQRNNPNLTAFRRGEGIDITGDRVGELGRLAEDTVEMLETTHGNPRSAGTNFSLRPTADAVTNGTNGVQRDSNHDGLFDSTDPGGSVDLNDTFKIHSGSRTNTDSAGCTTLHPDDYTSFRNAVTADADQTRWQYVLTSTTP